MTAGAVYILNVLWSRLFITALYAELVLNAHCYLYIPYCFNRDDAVCIAVLSLEYIFRFLNKDVYIYLSNIFKSETQIFFLAKRIFHRLRRP